MRRVAVIYIADERYHQYTEISIAALAAFHERPLDFYFMQRGYERAISPGLAAFLSGRSHFIEITNATTGVIPRLSRREKKHYITDTVLLKPFAIDNIANKYDRVVYLDGDVLAASPIDFNEMPHFDCPIAAAYDFPSYITIGGENLDIYLSDSQFSPEFFNAGVLIVNTTAWMRSDFVNSYSDNLRRHDELCPYRHNELLRAIPCKSWDQCAFNMTVNGNWSQLSQRWNAQKPLRHTSVWKSAYLRHYIGRRKFVPLYNRECDRKDHRLLGEISREAGLRIPGLQRYDGGLAFFLDGLRYRKQTKSYLDTISLLTERARRRGPVID